MGRLKGAQTPATSGVKKPHRYGPGTVKICIGVANMGSGGVTEPHEYLAMQYAGSYTVAGSHLPCSVLSVILWRAPAMQSILNGQTHLMKNRNAVEQVTRRRRQRANPPKTRNAGEEEIVGNHHRTSKVVGDCHLEF